MEDNFQLQVRQPFHSTRGNKTTDFLCLPPKLFTCYPKIYMVDTVPCKKSHPSCSDILAELASVVTRRAKRSVDDTNSTVPTAEQTEVVYYIRLRAFDKENNSASWSNIVSASFLKPEEFEKPVSPKWNPVLHMLCMCEAAL